MQMGEKRVTVSDGTTRAAPIFELDSLNNPGQRFALDAGIGALAEVEPDDPRASAIGYSRNSTAYRGATHIFQPEHVVALKPSAQEWHVGSPGGVIDTKVANSLDTNNSYIDGLEVNPLDGTRYLGVESDLWKLDEDFNVQWHITGPEPDDEPLVMHQMCILRDGGVAVAWSQDEIDEFHVYDPDGSMRWSKSLQESPTGVTCGVNNEVFVLESGIGVYRFNAKTGKRVWSNRGWGTDSHGTLAIAGGLLVAADASEDDLYCFEIETGSIARSIDVNMLTSGMVGAPGGKVVVTEYSDDRMKCVDVTTGSVLWTYEASTGYVHPVITTTPSPSGTMVYAGSWSGVEYGPIDGSNFVNDPDIGIYSAIATEWGRYDTYGDGW